MNIFRYDSKFSQVLMGAADLIILNILYLVCSLPLFTMGAAQVGLFTGIKVLMDKEDDSSCAKAFFQGFTSGFGKISLLHTVIYLLITILVLLLLNVLLWQYAGLTAPVWMVVAALVLFLMYHTMLAPFHATFDCKPGQLLRNVLLVTLARPFHAIAFAAALYLPVALMLVLPDIFVSASILFITIYYSGVYVLGFILLKKPFQQLKDNFADAQKAAAEAPVAEE